jgi:hypothetical protein
MSILYTSKSAQKNYSEYKSWLSSLKTGDPVLIQRFMRQGDSCLESQREHWQFSQAEYQAEYIYVRVTGSSTCHIEGIFYMSDRKTPVGNVFPQRLVPHYCDLKSDLCRAVAVHAPVYEPSWIKERCYVLVTHEENSHITCNKIRRAFHRSYSRKVVGGELYVIFDDIDRVKEKLSETGGTFLYAESLYD